MGRDVKRLKNYTAEQVEMLFESDENNRLGIKLYAILQLAGGYSSRKLTEFYHISFKQICNWADRFDAEGIEGLRVKPGRGRKPHVTHDQKYRLQGDLLKSPEDFGYNTANWTGALVRHHLEKSYQVTVKLSSAYKLMHEVGFSYRRARSIYHERDEWKRAQAKDEIKKTNPVCRQ
jgi:transposase